MSIDRGRAMAGLSASLATLLALPIIASILGVAGSTGLAVAIRCGSEAAYTLAPGQAACIEVLSSGQVEELDLTLTGPQVAGLTGLFSMVWNSSGFQDLGASPATRCLVAENSTVAPGVWRFEFALPPEAAAGVWEAEVVSEDGRGAAGFQVSTVFWDPVVVWPASFPNATPGKLLGTTARVAVSCNGDIRMTLGCTGLVGPSGLALPAGNLYLDDDQFHPELEETGDSPMQMGPGPIPGPTVEAGIAGEVTLHLFLDVPRPMKRGTITGNISYGFEPLNDTLPLLADAYISALRARREAYEPAQPVPISYAADLDMASHRSGLLYPLEYKLKQLDVLEEAGIDTVRITLAHDIFLEANQDKIDQLDQLVDTIRNRSMKLMIADGAAEAYWNDPMGWADFSRAFLDRVTEVATRYQPDYYLVVKEPLWYMGMNWTTPLGMLQEAITVEQWVNLTHHLCVAAEAASPQTMTGASITVMTPQSRLYLALIDQLESVDFVGVDIYMLPELDIVEANAAFLTKPKWIVETWDGHPKRQDGQAWRSTSSAEWIRMISSYAQSRGFDGMATFYNLYLCYDRNSLPNGLLEIWSALDDRQESFYALRDVASG